jgi:hypothetical protein
MRQWSRQISSFNSRLTLEELERRELLNGAGSPWLTGVYQALLGRAPDANGLAHWSRQMQSGMDQVEVALAVAGSAEANGDFVVQQYGHLLNRAADATGQQAFDAALNPGMARTQVQADLLGSDEYFAHAGGTPAGFLAGLYHDTLGRDADANGLATYGQALTAGVSRTAVAEAVVTSEEACRGQVAQMYQDYLQRPPDATGLNAWVAALHQGASPEQVAAGILGSAEFQALVASAASNGSAGSGTTLGGVAN